VAEAQADAPPVIDPDVDQADADAAADDDGGDGVWLTASQAAPLLGVAAATVADWVDAGKLQGARTDGGDRRRGSVRVRLSEVRRKARALGRPLSAAELATLTTLTTRTVPPGGAHGTRTAFNRGCRCEACVEANRSYMRDWQARHRRPRRKGAGTSNGKGKGKGQAGSHAGRAGYARATTLDELLREW